MLPSEYLTKGWTQGTFARDINGGSVNEYDSAAVCWCVSGAISRALPLSCQKNASELLTEQIENIIGKDIILWNDDAKTTQEQVIQIVQKAEQNINFKYIASQY